MGTEYTVRVGGVEDEYTPLGKMVNTGKGRRLVFIWAIHPSTLFTHLSVWVKSEYGKSWPLEGFEYDILRDCKHDYSQIGK